MPATLTYPGIYIEEVPSGVRTIAGASTSNTAFVDWFPRGPMNEPVRITSFGEFERIFGGLDARSEASYAVQQYYLNGGSIAFVVRVAGGTPQPVAAQRVLQGGTPAEDVLTVAAANPGTWGNDVQVSIAPGQTGTFNLLAQEVVTVGGQDQVVSTEAHLNLTMDPTAASYAVSVVNNGSALVRLTDEGAGPGVLPANTAFQDLAGGTDGSVPDSAALLGNAGQGTGMFALNRIDPFTFNLLCLPAAANLDPTPGASLATANLAAVITGAEAFCEEKRAFLIVDVPSYVNTQTEMSTWLGTNAVRHRNAAVYFPRLQIPDRLAGNRPRDVGPSGTMAGVFARIDATRGVWKAPAGTEASLRGANVATRLTDGENGALNPVGINALRNFAIFGNVSWGARTLDGADQQASEWKYIPIRRTALYIEDSLFQGLKWVVFEPNDEPLWAQIRLNVGAFMRNLFRQGAFQGKTPAEAYFVKCDAETTTQNDRDRGIVNILVGFAPLKPAEFVVIKIQQMAGQIET
jgi:phage tail sheath protein FI